MNRNIPGICERCAQRWPLWKLQPQRKAGKRTDILVCPDCLDDDVEAWTLGGLRLNDPRPIRRPAGPMDEDRLPMGPESSRLNTTFQLNVSKLQ